MAAPSSLTLWASSGSPSPQSTIMHGGCKSRGRTAGPGLPPARPRVENAARAGPGRCGLPSRARWLANENSARTDDVSVPAQARLRPTRSQAGASVRAVHRQRGWLLRACVTHQVAQSAPRPSSPDARAPDSERAEAALRAALPLSGPYSRLCARAPCSQRAADPRPPGILQRPGWPAGRAGGGQCSRVSQALGSVLSAQPSGLHHHGHHLHLATPLG